MQSFTLYFQFYGHKFKTAIQADTLEQAKQMVRNRIGFIDNVQPSRTKRNEGDITVEHLRNMFGMK